MVAVRRIILLLLFALASRLALAQHMDNSDWWSLLREDTPREVKPSNKDLDERNFRIAGISLDSKMFERAAATLGKGKEVERGDASTGRHQVCYESTAGPKKVYLIYEFGEVEETFYLFRAGQDWEGSGFCFGSKRVTARLSTPSGLRLGLTRSELKGILGPPDFENDDRNVYFRRIERKTSPEEFVQMRKDYPGQLSDEEAHKQFDYFTVDMYIAAKFSQSKLIYLAVSRLETN